MRATASSFGASHLVLETGSALPFGARVQLQLPTYRHAVSPTVDGVEWGATSGGCRRETEPDDAESNAYVIEACVGGLVETIRPLVAAAAEPPPS